MLNSASSSSTWTLIHQIQSMFLIMLTYVYLPDDVKQVIIGFKFAFVFFDIIPIKRTNVSKMILDTFDSNQSNAVLNDIGIESGSSIVNLYSFLWSLIIIAMAQITFKFIQILIRKYVNHNKWRWIFKSIDILINKILKALTFAYYIRAFLELHQYILISTVSEVNVFNASSGASIASTCFAIWVLVVCWAVIGFALWQSTFTHKDFGESKKFDELFQGIKKSRCARLYVIWLMFRRTIFIVFLISFPVDRYLQNFYQ